MILSKRFVALAGLLGFIAASVLFTLFSRTYTGPEQFSYLHREYLIGMYSFLAAEFLLFTLAALYVFGDRESLAQKLFAFVLFFFSTIAYLWGTFTIFRDSYGAGGGNDFLIGISSFIGALLAFSYFSSNSLRLYQNGDKKWPLELLAAILVLAAGFKFSGPGLSYGGLVLLPFGALVALLSLIALLVKAWKHAERTFFFTALTLLVVILAGLGILLTGILECCH